MTLALRSLHWPAILVATVVYFVIAIPWFSPAGLGPVFERALGFKPPPGWEPGSVLYLVPLVANLVAAIATALLAHSTGAAKAVDGAILGLVVALGYSVAVAGVDAVSPSHPDPSTLFLITGSYHLVGLVLVGVIVTVWRKRGPMAGSAR